MKRLNLCSIVVLLMINSSLFAQESVYVGMTADEFKKTLPGVLPDKIVFNGDLSLNEKLYSINGKWWFGIYGNVLKSAYYQGESKIKSEEDFNKWVESAKLIIKDYTKIYGQPNYYDSGINTYTDKSIRKNENTIGQREVYEEAYWKTKTMEIKISCDYRSNYYDEFSDGLSNGPGEWFFYFFQIKYSPITEIKEVKLNEAGRFYPGMDVYDFVKVFPALFPEGVKMTGQWVREQNVDGLNGSRGYTFKDGKLKWIHFQKYVDEINEENFNKCLSATKQLIKEYTVSFGSPDTTITGNTKFVDPFKDMHSGYDVLEVRWDNYKDMKIKIEFTFMGGKGGYHFLVVMNYFDKDYPYYD